MHTCLADLPKRITRARARVAEAVYVRRVPLAIESYELPGEPVGFAEAAPGPYTPFELGTRWGRPWGTTWFRLSGALPADATGRWELVVDLGFDQTSPGFQAEALAWTADGRPIKGIHPHNAWVPVELAPGESGVWHLEAASNPPLHTTRDTAVSDLDTAGRDPLYRFASADLAQFDPEIFGLEIDLGVLAELAAELPEGARRAQIYTALEQALDVLDLRDIPHTAPAARRELVAVLSRHAHASEHVVSAVGHAHIDSAWLWPVRETVRKCARTFSNVTALADLYPDTVFACSQVAQYAWMRDRYPDLWGRIKQAVADGTWEPVGGMWVECDGNLPGGEALVRQFTYGKRFLEAELGVSPREVWLPDTFGYSGALPQIMRLAEARWFMSQKMSWNTTDVFPHHTFWWEGIDGTRIFTHFPPSNTYNAEVSGCEVARSARTFADAGPTNRSLMAFGYGDGGGGPTRNMMERARRLRDLEGSPRVVIETPAAFFSKAEAEYDTAPVWVGEMYLEFHRGTYTTHVATKQGNRRAEHLLFEAELWWATAAILAGADYPYDTLDDLWRRTLFLQFHDILPGSSIRWVHREAAEEYRRLAAELGASIREALNLLAGQHPDDPETAATVPAAAPSPSPGRFVANPAPHARAGIPAFGSGWVERPALVTPRREGSSYVLDNRLLRVTVGADGTITSLVDVRDDRELVPAGHVANLLQLHPDHPNQYEAWDIESFYRSTREDLTAVETLGVEGDTVVVTRRFGGESRVTQRVSLAAGEPRVDITTEVDWHERERLLKLAFPLDLHATTAASEIQFGYVTRPVHENTSWDAAKFETAAQRWVHVSEGSYGVAILNAGTYGHDVSRPRTGESRGRLPTTVRQTLVRGPLYPDPRADEGRHLFTSALLVGDISDATRHGYDLALPMRDHGQTQGERVVWSPVVSSSNPDVVVSAVKLADDRSGDLVVRVYESTGARAESYLQFGFDAEDLIVVNVLERGDGVAETLTKIEQVEGLSQWRVQLGPFQIVTLRVRRPR